MTHQYKGRHALVVGGSCALAIGLAETLMAKGLYPILSYRSDAGKARIDSALQDGDGKYECFFLDLAKAETIGALEPFLAMGIDYLVDFAQGDLEGLVASVDASAVGPYVEANIANRASVIQKIARSMVSRRQGRMVYVSSVAAGRPNPGQGFYAAAKQATEALYRNAGLELAPRGVTTVTLRPGYVDAGRGKRYLKKNADVALAKVPLGRALEAEEVVDAIMFLLSDSAAGFNATALTMDGGLSAGK